MPILGVHNFSSKIFDDHALSVLNLGLKFVKSKPAISDEQLLSDMAEFERKVHLRHAFGEHVHDVSDSKFRVKNGKFIPPAAPAVVESFVEKIRTALQDFHNCSSLFRFKPNMSRLQSNAVRCLRNDRDIIIKPSDKNMGLCVVDKSWYTQECLRQLSDATTYSKVQGMR
jgi:hypothetical protein